MISKITYNLSKSNALLIFFALAFGYSANAQTTLGEIKDDGSTSCNISVPVCDGDTIRLSPANTVGFTNFQWYLGSVAGGNEINTSADDASVFAVSNDSITVVSSGGTKTYILTGEYNTPAGCMALNDTIIMDFQAIPDLATTPDTICTGGGESIDLTTLVTNSASTSGMASGTAKWYGSLADAMAETPELASSTVSPGATTKYYVRQTSLGSAACFDIDSVQIVVSCLSLGNIVWYDTDNNGTLDGGESTIDDVVVNLFLDADGNGMLTGAEQTPYATTATASGGKYLFENLPEGGYFVGIPSSEFGSGEPLENLYSSQTAYDASGNISEITANNVDANNSDTDDNGMLMGASSFYDGGVLSSSVELAFQGEPTGESPDDSTNDDKDGNMTVDFGFYGMSVGSYVFNDIDNNGLYDGSDSGISGAEVRLYLVTATDTTYLTSTTTDGMGQYLFNNLPEGDYMVGVVTPSGTESSLDPVNAGTPNMTDNDDNGIRVLVDTTLTAAFTLDAGNAPTGETGPAIADSDNPDDNSNLNVDLGFKPICVVISNPMGAQPICAGNIGTDLTVDFSTNAQNIRFVRYATPQSGTDMYMGGTGLDTVTVTGSGPTYLATLPFETADFPNTSNTTAVTYYVYAVLENTPADPTCRPFQEIQVVVNPLPTAAPTTLTVCENVLGSDIGTFTLTAAATAVLGGQTGMTTSYHPTQAAADAGMPTLTATVDSLHASVVYVRVQTAQGCYATSAITLNTNPKPAFSLSLPTVCPGEEPYILITRSTDSDAEPTVQLNSETAVAFSTLPNATANTADVTTAQGLNLGVNNTIRLENSTGCDHSETLNPNNVIPKVCLPVKIERLNK